MLPLLWGGGGMGDTDVSDHHPPTPPRAHTHTHTQLFGDCVSIVPTDQFFLTRTTQTIGTITPNTVYGDYI